MLPLNYSDEWQLYSADNFNYLNQSGCYTVDGINDAKEFADTRVCSDFTQSIETKN